MLGASLLLVGIGAILLSAAFDHEPTVRLVGQNQPVNVSARRAGDISAHNSPSLVRNPVRPANLAVSSRIDTPVFDCALHVSADGGATWTQTAIPAPPKAEGGKCYAPDVAFSADGTLYLSFVTLKGRGNVPHAAWLSKSTDGGRTLSDPLKVGGRLNFQVRLAADPVRPGRLYRTWLEADDVGTLKFTAPGNPIQIARSDDGGATWSAPVRVSSPAHQRAVSPTPVVAHDGTVYVLYRDLGGDRLNYEGAHQGRGGEPYPGPSALVLARSRDGGATWLESVAGKGLIPIERFVVFLASFPSLAVDRDGRVYAAYHSKQLGDPDVMLWSLAPGDSSWRGPTRVNDTPPRDGTAQYLPRLSVAPDGRLDVVYYDRRADRENLRNHVSLQSSFDHGKTFTPAVRLTSAPSDSRIGFGAKEGLPDLGSRLALLSTNRAALGVWTDTRAGVPATQKQDLAAAAVAVSDPMRLSDGVRDALRYGGIAIGLAGLALLALALRRRASLAAAA
ncbi:MAG: glycoside hydrolase [Actinobacteria bacterium]|nr:glycoside hydrolase [Actinomycetota bacterium]